MCSSGQIANNLCKIYVGYETDLKSSHNDKKARFIC